jgi:transposase
MSWDQLGVKDHAAQPVEGCRLCVVLRKRNHRLRQRLRDLEARSRQTQVHLQQMQQQLSALQQKLDRNSRNSSIPPSANPPHAPPPVVKTPTGRHIGAQAGHPGYCRAVLPPEQVDEVIEHRPRRCQRCRRPLPDDGAEVVGRHQVMELPPRAVLVREHRALGVCCPHCRHVTRGVIPPAVRRSVCGERLSSALCLVSARVHGSRRMAAELLAEVLGAPLSLGSVSAREREMSGALAGDYELLKRQVRRAPVKHADETGWRRAARYLWVAATARAAVFHLDRSRSSGAMNRLLGEKIAGVLCTDRYGPYERHPPRLRQLCWSHLKRDFVARQEQGGLVGRWADRALKLTASLFEQWRRYKRGQIAHATLRHKLQPVRQRMRRLLGQGVRGQGAYGQGAYGPGGRGGVNLLKGLCVNLLRLEPAMWTFTRVTGVEPTNNHAERMLRPAVQWRKKCLGSHSEAGCRFAERMLSIIQTCRLRGQSVIDHLEQALRLHRQTALITPA